MISPRVQPEDHEGYGMESASPRVSLYSDKEERRRRRKEGDVKSRKSPISEKLSLDRGAFNEGYQVLKHYISYVHMEVLFNKGGTTQHV